MASRSRIFLGYTAAASVSVVLSGVGSTSAVGTPTITIEAPLAGVEATGAAGTLVAGLASALDGVGASGGVGTLSVSVEVALSGVGATGAVGTPDPHSSSTVPISGNAAAGGVGTVVPGISTSVLLAGNEAVGSVGTVGGEHVVPLTNNVGTCSIGSVLPTFLQALVAAGASGSVGTLGIISSSTVALTGVGGVGGAGLMGPYLITPPVELWMPYRNRSFFVSPRIFRTIHPTSVRSLEGSDAFGSPTVTTQTTILPEGWDDASGRLIGTSDAWTAVGDAFGGHNVFVGLHPTGKMPLGMFKEDDPNPDDLFLVGEEFGVAVVGALPAVAVLRGHGDMSRNAIGFPSVTNGRLLLPQGWDDRTFRTLPSYQIVGDKFGTAIVSAPATLHKSLALVSMRSFEPSPPGAARPGTLSSGFSGSIHLFPKGAGGPSRLLMNEAFGYSILSLTDPMSPTALMYHDTRFPAGGPNSVYPLGYGGDGQSDVSSIGVSEDGQRATFSMGGPADTWNAVSSSPGVSEGFVMWGSHPLGRALGVVVHHTSGRYVSYAFDVASVFATDITTLPGEFTPLNMVDNSENTGWTAGEFPVIAGNFLAYHVGAGIRVVDISSPGSIGSITAGMPSVTVTNTDFGTTRRIGYHVAVVDPNNALKIWLLVEFAPAAGENSPTYGLMSVTNLSKSFVSPLWRVPAAAGDLWLVNGYASGLVAFQGSVFVLMWTWKRSPSTLFRLYSTTADAWGLINSSAPPGQFDVPTQTYGNFSTSFPMCLNASSTRVYAYVPTGSSAWVLELESA